MTQHLLPINSAAGKLVYEHLRARSSNTRSDLGEDESIALWLAELTDAMFVTMDKGAAYQALVELGPARVCSPFDLCDWLRQQGCVSDGQFRSLYTELCGKITASRAPRFVTSRVTGGASMIGIVAA